MSSLSGRQLVSARPVPQFAVLWLDPRAEAATYTVPFVHGDADLKARLAHAIRQAREDAGLSRPDLARQVGVSRNAVLAWEKGASVPGMLNLGALADALGVSADLFAHPPVVRESPVAPWRLEAIAQQAADAAVDEALARPPGAAAPPALPLRARRVKR